MELLTFNENGVEIKIPGNSAHPTKSVPFYNPKMASNRYLVYLTLRCLSDDRKDILECLDAFSASGIMGIQWMSHLRERLSVYMSEMNKTACSWIEKNIELNKLAFCKMPSESLTDERTEPLKPNAFVINDDCNVVMQRKSFDFIHLDPFGSACLHLEPAFRRLRHQGILTLTSTDSASLFARNPQVVRRNYAAEVVKTEYVKEMAVRIIIAAAVRAAARCNKGIKVLFSVCAEHYFLIALQVVRGPSFANEAITNVRRLLHCRICEERIFLPDQLSPIEDPYSLLSCKCRSKEPGKTAVVLGPMWKGAIFCPDFVSRLIAESNRLNVEINPNFRLLLRLLSDESAAGSSSISQNKNSNEDEPPNKMKKKTSSEQPAFYYFPSRMNLSNVDIPKIDRLIEMMRARGFVCTRTHFEPTALRTDCSLNQFKEIIKDGTV